MEMKINLNKLFNFSESYSHTPSTTSLQNSYHIDEPSITSTPSENINLYYKFSEALFFDSSQLQQNDYNIDLLEDLSSIGKSFDNPSQKQTKQKANQIKQNKPSFKNQNKAQFKNQHTLYPNDKQITNPGQRLYYEFQIKNERKMRQLEKIKHEIEEQRSKQITFKPSLNQKSKKILQLAQSPLYKINNLKKSQKKISNFQSIKSTIQIKEEEELKNCTFKPAITKGPNSRNLYKKIHSEKDLSKVFESLYNQHKIKQKRRIKALKQTPKNQKKMTQQQLDQFFKKNEEYMNEIKHKKELLKAVSSQYDLTSGQKLFEPKINIGKKLMTSLSVQKLIHSPLQKRNKGSFFSRTKQLTSSYSLKNIKNISQQSGKSGVSIQSQKKNSYSTAKKTQQFIYDQNLIKKQNIIQKDQKIKTNQIKQKKIQKNNKAEYTPLPYQVTTINQPQDYSDSAMQYQKPYSTIFNKMKVTESVFQQRQESSEEEQVNDKIQKKSQVNSYQQEQFQQNQNAYQNHQLNQQDLKSIYFDSQGGNQIENQKDKSENSQYKNQEVIVSPRQNQPFNNLKTESNQQQALDQQSSKQSVHNNYQTNLCDTAPQLNIRSFQQISQSNVPKHHQTPQQNDQVHSTDFQYINIQNDQSRQAIQNESEREYKKQQNNQNQVDSLIIETQTDSKQQNLFVGNPINFHKYNDLLDLLNQKMHSQIDAQSNDEKRYCQNIPEIQSKVTILQSQIIPPQKINQAPLTLQHDFDQVSKEENIHNLENNRNIIFKPVSISKDSNSQKYDIAQPKSWSQIFNNSLKFEKNLQQVSSESSKISQFQKQKTLQTKQEPQKIVKKTINIASLLKAKKKLSIKPNQN